ncbi:MAG: tRNA pseudouridine(38-40) synthase TruA [Acidimicrobiia bacterium]
MPTYRLDLAYDGGGFRGLARQEGQRTVQGALEDALARSLRQAVTTVAAGRTDAGVHARQQVMSFVLAQPVETVRLLRSLVGLLGPEIVPYSLVEVDDAFDARRSALSRAYRYQILNAPFADPLRRHTTWHVADALDVEGMDRAVQPLIGEHDFAAFCRANSAGGTVRRLLQAGWSREDLVVLTITAGSFCHQMVRSIVGLSVEVGRGKRPPGLMADVLAARQRSGQLAPPHGLTLWEVAYPVD